MYVKCVCACVYTRTHTHTIYGWGNKLEGKKSFGIVVLRMSFKSSLFTRNIQGVPSTFVSKYMVHLIVKCSSHISAWFISSQCICCSLSEAFSLFCPFLDKRTEWDSRRSTMEAQPL